MAKDNKQFVQDIADINQDFPQWYTDVVLKTELVDYGPVKGTMVIRPYGYAIWENIQKELDRRFKETGHKNAYFPMFIPLSYLMKEAEHVEGFAPEVALVTHVGNEELPEKLVVRPTSETIICEMYRRWVQSYRDLPVLINQWANVVRWEKTTRPFLRTSEFLWQEGHTLHRTKEEAEAETQKMLEVYREFAENALAIPMLAGRKTDKEKFAGAVETYGIEAMMLDGKSLQAGTSHFLGNNFSSAFEIKYLDSDGTQKNPWQTSWGASTRLIGAVVMVHGDERGLKLPPVVAPIQAIVIPIASHKEGVVDKAQELTSILTKAGIRAEIDISEQSAGWKFNQYEMKGVPLRIEIGPRDIEAGNCVLVRRDTGDKIVASLTDIDKTVADMLKTIQRDMYLKALAFRDSHIIWCDTLEEIGTAINNKNFAKSNWCGERECEDKIKELYAATSRVMPFGEKCPDGNCPICGKKATKIITWARAY